MPHHVFSISIEHGFIKCLLTQGLKVKAHRVIMASPAFFREGLVRDTERIGAMLKAAAAEMGARSAKVVGAVPGFQNGLRVLEIPVATGLDPDVVIPREAARTMGVSLDISMLKWRRLDGGADRSRWVAISASRRAVNVFSETAKLAGLKVKRMELRPFALARTVNDPNAIIAWVAPDGCEVVIVRNSIPVSHQAVYWGAEPVEGSVLIYRLNEILERIMTGYDTESTQGSLPADTSVYVTGSPISLDPTIADKVTANLQRTEGILKPPLQLPADFPIHDFAVNIGMALGEA